MKKILIWAILLRVLVSIFIFHPDIKTFNYQSSFLKDGVFNIYTYLVDNKANLSLKDNFVYFPLTYFTLGGYQATVSPLLGDGFNDWLANANTNAFVTDPNIFKYLFVLKLPYLVLDIAIAFLLMKFFDDKEKKKKVFTIWLFNPFTIVLIYVFGNIDIFPVFLTVASFLLLRKNKPKGAAALLGFAAGFKLYPLLFVPFLVLSGKKLKDKIVLGALPFLIFAAISLPFLSKAFIQSTLISGLTTRIFNPSFGVGFGESIIVGLLGYSALFCYAMIFDRKPDLFKYWISLFLIIFAFSHFHVQWLLWLAPFWAILAAKEKALDYLLFGLAFLAITIPFIYEDRSMSFGLFRVYSLYYDLLPTPFTVVQKVFDPYNLQSILHSLFAGGSLVLVYKLFRKEKALKEI